MYNELPDNVQISKESRNIEMKKAESLKTDFDINMMGDLGIGLFNN